MTPELDRALCEKYPLIFKDRHGHPRDTAMCWGLAVGEGWYDLIDALCSMIYHPYLQAKAHYERGRVLEGAARITAVEVERYRLSMAAAAEALPIAVQVKEKFGTLRFYVNGGTPEAQAYIDFAEYYSGRLCEQCGAPGKIRGKGWLRTLCEAHAIDREAG